MHFIKGVTEIHPSGKIQDFKALFLSALLLLHSSLGNTKIWHTGKLYQEILLGNTMSSSWESKAQDTWLILGCVVSLVDKLQPLCRYCSSIECAARWSCRSAWRELWHKITWKQNCLCLLSSVFTSRRQNITLTMQTYGFNDNVIHKVWSMMWHKRGNQANTTEA